MRVGKAPITKGPGGQYTHHRGIFIGWSKLGFNGKSYDRWHMKDGAIVHQKFHEHKTRGNTASITSVTQWNDGGKKPILDEERTMTVWTPEEGWARVVIFFKSKLTATYGDVALKGDPEHAGIQYRPADEVNRKKTRYLFPKEEITAGNVKKHKDLAWIAETCWLGDKAHSVVQLNHPGNPKGTVHSAYRDYGRFGSFFEKDIKKGETLTVNYAFAIVDGELPSRSEIQEASRHVCGDEGEEGIERCGVLTVSRFAVQSCCRAASLLVLKNCSPAGPRPARIRSHAFPATRLPPWSIPDSRRG